MPRRRSALLPVAALLLAAATTCQSPVVDGYAHDVAGEIVAYDSALPEVRSALLVRSLQQELAIAWDTAPAPSPLPDGPVHFLWLFGIDADAETHVFELQADGRPLLRFANPVRHPEAAWTVTGSDGVALHLRPTRMDRHGDTFGFAELVVPSRLLVAGAPLHLRVVGETANSRIWYMTFRAAPRATARLWPQPTVQRHGDRQLQPVVVEMVHLGDPVPAAVRSSFAPPRTVTLQLGTNRVELLHPAVTAPVAVHVDVDLGGAVAHALDATLQPVRPWTVHLVQHSHTDLGYTRPPTEILAEHLRFLDYALDYCDQTAGLDDDARFRWTCEAAWPVQQWLRSRPAEQVERLRRRVRDGSVELTAMHSNLSELLDERSCAASLQPLAELAAAGLPVRAAMQDDVNGLAWCFADWLPAAGVRWLEMGEHDHRALLPFAVPTAFWWEAPSGRRLLAFRADHYMTGNYQGLHQGDVDVAAPNLLRYLDDLQQRGYPHDRVAVHYAGVFIDNSPPGIAACRLVQEWNRRFVWPHLRSSTVGEFLGWVEREHGRELPVHRQAWPDWWSDGIGSAPREAAAVRTAQGRLTAVEALLALDQRLGETVSPALLEDLRATRERLVLYGEHTYGAAESVREPLAANTLVQWQQKAAWAWEAVKATAQLEEAALGLLQGHLQRGAVPTITAINTLGVSRSDVLRVFVDRELLPPGRAFTVVDDDGRPVPCQLDKREADGAFYRLHVRDVPACGFRTLQLRPGAGTLPVPTPTGERLRLANDFYELEFDPRTGTLRRLYDRELGRDLADGAAPHPFLQLLHEALGDRGSLERKELGACTRTPAVVTAVRAGSDGPLWRSVVVTGHTPLCPLPDGFRLEVRLFDTHKRIEFEWRMRLRRDYAPQSLYVAMPFALAGGAFGCELAGGVVDPARDLLPGTSADWQVMQGHLALADGKARVLLASRDALLLQLGGLQLGRFRPVAAIERPHVYPWLCNNYWVTNFRAADEGDLQWTFALTSGPDGPPADGLRFGQAEAVPLLGRVLPAVAPTGLPARPAEASLLVVEPADVQLVAVTPAAGDQGIRLQLRAIGGREVQATVRAQAGGEPLLLLPVDVLGRPLGAAARAVRLPAGGSGFVQVRDR